jgi:hypothetical protein
LPGGAKTTTVGHCALREHENRERKKEAVAAFAFAFAFGGAAQDKNKPFCVYARMQLLAFILFTRAHGR